MRWSPQPLDIGRLDGFNKTDLFQYRDFGEHLANLIGSLEDDPVFVLDGPWGSGKTTFAHQLAGVLRMQGHVVAYFDAFSADHHKDPFLALVEEIHSLAKEAGVASDADALRKFRTAAVAVGKELGLTTVEGALPGLGRFVRLAAETASEAEEPLLENWLKEAQERRKAVTDFKKRVSRVAESLATRAEESQQDDDTSSEADDGIRPRVVFIVDELDRCRPTFALAVLERIKHLFGVERFTFLLVANLKELGKSVLRVYGDVDDVRYSEKFFEIVVRLPQARIGETNSKVRPYVQYLSQQLRFPTGRFLGSPQRALCALAEAENLSLRSLEHTMRQALVLAPSAPPRVIALLPVLRVSRPELFRRLVNMAREPLTDDERAELGELADHMDDANARDSLLSELEPKSQLVYFARLLDQYRVG